VCLIIIVCYTENVLESLHKAIRERSYSEVLQDDDHHHHCIHHRFQLTTQSKIRSESLPQKAHNPKEGTQHRWELFSRHITKNIGTKHLPPGLIKSGVDRPQDTVIWRNIDSDNLLLVNCSDEIDDDPATNQSDTESMNDYFQPFLRCQQ
jgi:hypothetical protein